MKGEIDELKSHLNNRFDKKTSITLKNIFQFVKKLSR